MQVFKTVAAGLAWLVTLFASIWSTQPGYEIILFIFVLLMCASAVWLGRESAELRFQSLMKKRACATGAKLKFE